MAYRTNKTYGTSNSISLLIIGRDQRVHCQYILQTSAYWHLCTPLLKRGDHAFCGNVSDQRVLRKWASAKTTDSGIKATTTGIVRRKQFGYSILGGAMKVHANIIVGVLAGHRFDYTSNKITARDCDSVSERNRSNTYADQSLNCLPDFILIPRIAIRISERHRNVNDHIQACIVCLCFNRSQHSVAFFDCLVLVLAQKCLRDRTRVTQGRNAFGGNTALGTLLINHDGDNLHVLRHIDLLQHLFTIAHLWNCLWRDKTYSIDVLESRCDQRAQITRLKFRRDLAFQPLPGVPRAFNQFDAIVSHGNCSAYLKNSFAFSKKPFRIGVFSSPQRAANSSSLRRCSPFKRDGTSTISRANKSPCPRPLTLTIPFPRSLNICLLCVPAVTLRCALPSKVGTSISPPKAATENGIGTSQYRSSPSR